jgi:uncharacterized paraquat-inducible protein A
MLNADITGPYPFLAECGTTLWYCDGCSEFISIHSAQALHEAFCPACGDVLLQFCKMPNSAPSISFDT